MMIVNVCVEVEVEGKTVVLNGKRLIAHDVEAAVSRYRRLYARNLYNIKHKVYYAVMTHIEEDDVIDIGEYSVLRVGLKDYTEYKAHAVA